MSRQSLLMIAGIVLVLLINHSILRYRAGHSNSTISASKTFPALTLKNDAWKPATLDANTFGGKVTVVNFLASWCNPCIAEMPELVKLKKASAAQFYGIVWNDTPATMREWLKKFGNPFDAVWYDDTASSARTLGLRGVPETFVIDKKGIIRFRMTGMITPELAEEKILPLLVKLRYE